MLEKKDFVRDKNTFIFSIEFMNTSLINFIFDQKEYINNKIILTKK